MSTTMRTLDAEDISLWRARLKKIGVTLRVVKTVPPSCVNRFGDGGWNGSKWILYIVKEKERALFNLIYEVGHILTCHPDWIGTNNYGYGKTQYHMVDLQASLEGDASSNFGEMEETPACIMTGTLTWIDHGLPEALEVMDYLGFAEEAEEMTKMLSAKFELARTQLGVTPPSLCVADEG